MTNSEDPNSALSTEDGRCRCDPLTKPRPHPTDAAPCSEAARLRLLPLDQLPKDRPSPGVGLPGPALRPLPTASFTSPWAHPLFRSGMMLSPSRARISLHLEWSLPPQPQAQSARRPTSRLPEHLPPRSGRLPHVPVALVRAPDAYEPPLKPTSTLCARRLPPLLTARASFSHAVCKHPRRRLAKSRRSINGPVTNKGQ